MGWLAEQRAAAVWLTTGPGTKAAAFYERRGWVRAGPAERGDVRYELDLSRRSA